VIALLVATALFHLAEKTEGGKAISYPDSSIVDADSNSAIEVRLDRDALVSFSDPAGASGGFSGAAFVACMILRGLR